MSDPAARLRAAAELLRERGRIEIEVAAEPLAAWLDVAAAEVEDLDYVNPEWAALAFADSVLTDPEGTSHGYEV
jgi:accessory colonization factor AcfC